CAEATSDPEAQRRLLTFVLVGGGPTRVEMAGALAELTRATLARDFRNIRPPAARILLIEAVPRLLHRLQHRLAASALSALRRMEVEARLNSPIEAIDAESARVAGEKISASTVSWCAGVKSTPVGEWLGVETERNGGIRVTPDLSLPGHPEVFVLGDAAVVAEGPDERPLPWLAAVAAQQGKYVGKLIASRVAGRTNTQPFRYRNLGTMATIGRSAAVADFGRVKLTGRIAWLLWGFVHIYLLIGFRNRLSVFVNWMWSWIAYGRGARLITGPIEAPPGLQSKGDDTAAAPPAPGRSTAHWTGPFPFSRPPSEPDPGARRVSPVRTPPAASAPAGSGRSRRERSRRRRDRGHRPVPSPRRSGRGCRSWSAGRNRSARFGRRRRRTCPAYPAGRAG